jgi:hypothetical protein
MAALNFNLPPEGPVPVQLDSGAHYEYDIDLLPPASLTQPLWRSLLSNIRHVVAPEKFPPLLLTSRPMNIGMLLGDAVSLPWYRTVFTNLGNVINPEVLPPLELESRPMDVGELISDQMGHPWWQSLIRSLADEISPERLPRLEVTSAPMDASLDAGNVHIVRWSSVISTPKVFLPDKPKPPDPAFVLQRPATAPAFGTPEVNPLHAEANRIQGHLSRSRIREYALIGVALAEITYLVGSMVGAW